MSGDEERVSKRAQTNYPGKVSFGDLSKEENEHSVARVSRCADTGTCAWTEDGTKPQLLGGLGEEVGGGSSLQQTAEEEFGQLSFLLGEPQVCLETSTDAAAALLEQAVSDPQKIQDKLLQLAVQLAGECQHSAPLKSWDPKDPKANTTCGKLQAQVVAADVDIEVRHFVLAQQQKVQLLHQYTKRTAVARARSDCVACPLRYYQSNKRVDAGQRPNLSREAKNSHTQTEVEKQAFPLFS